MASLEQYRKMWSVLRLPSLCSVNGHSRSTNYRHIADGLLTKPIRIGLRAVGWPDYEVEAINQARLQGKSDDEIRELVSRLMEARKAPQDQTDGVTQ